MPVHKATGPQGGKGYQYGGHGKVYTGPGAHAKAVRQAAAIHAQESRAAKMKPNKGMK
jgi:hypothetical protein